MTGIIIGALSGTSFQISDPTGAMSAILIGIVAKDGLQNKSLRHCTFSRTSRIHVHFGTGYGSSSSFRPCRSADGYRMANERMEQHQVLLYKKIPCRLRKISRYYGSYRDFRPDDRNNNPQRLLPISLNSYYNIKKMTLM